MTERAEDPLPGSQAQGQRQVFLSEMDEGAGPALIDATTAAFKTGKIASIPFAVNKGAAIPPPPNLGSNLGSRSGVPPQGPPGMMPPPGMHPADPMGPGGPMMMGPHGPMPPPMMGMRPPMMRPMGTMGPMMGPIGPMRHMRSPMNGPPPPMVGPPPMKK
ncbi:RU1C protein, partial [Pseudoatta argentina]